MKRPTCFCRNSLLYLAASLLVLTISGCLSMPRMTHQNPSIALESAGPPVWDDQPSSNDSSQRRNIAATTSDTAAKGKSSVTNESLQDSKSSKSKPQKKKRPAGRIAGRGTPPQLVDEPREFSWTVAAKSSGERDIQSVVIGQGGYRTLLIGSLAGNDEVAVQLTERLAKHVHENQIVLGGIQLTIVRNLNPDGEASNQPKTDHGIYLNRHFPQTTEDAVDVSALPTENQFLLNEILKQQPQRVIHVRTIGREQGVVACSSGAKDVAGDLSNWLGFELMELPGRSVKGTLERYLSESERCDIVTLAMPKEISVDDAWDLYSDALLNLLMDEDFATRKLAREQKASKAADSRNRND